MNPTRLMAVALCAVACVTTSVYAEDKQTESAPFESATAVQIPDPKNPKPGMLFKGYNIQVSGYGSKLASELKDVPAIKTTVDTADTFSLGNCSQGVWEGFLKGKLASKCTILVHSSDSYALYINGQSIAIGVGLNAAYVDIKEGFNHFKLYSRGNVSMSIKVVESTKEPKPITPKDLYYDEKPDKGDVF